MIRWSGAIIARHDRCLLDFSYGDGASLAAQPKQISTLSAGIASFIT
jgi:hypothetical protein